MTQNYVLIASLAVVCIMAISFYWNDWVTKFITLAMFVCLANAVYFTFDGVKGWPAEEPNEIHGTMASIVIQNPSSTEKGAIYISVYLKDELKWWEYKYPRLAPKTYYIEYSNNRAAEFEKAKQAMQEGKEVRINGIPPKEAGDGQGEEAQGDNFDIQGAIQNLVNRMLSQQKDTYKPTTKNDLEIVEQGAPPPKGTNP